MGHFPALTAKQVVRALKQAGFIEDRQKGSHLILINQATKARTVVRNRWCELLLMTRNSRWRNF